MPRCAFVHKNKKVCAGTAKKGAVYCVDHLPKANDTETEEGDARDTDIEDDLDLPMPPVRKQGKDYGAMIKDMKAQIDSLAKDLQELKGVGRRKMKVLSPPSDKRIWRKAKYLYYREVKNDEEILKTILTRLKSSDLIHQGATTKNIPWMNVKMVSDHMFDNKSDVDKQMYFDLSRELLVKGLKIMA
jgi:hypothetical protein